MYGQTRPSAVALRALRPSHSSGFGEVEEGTGVEADLEAKAWVEAGEDAEGKVEKEEEEDEEAEVEVGWRRGSGGGWRRR